ncbi:MAG: hypothetical protein EZS28_007211 [Streblomastix strix]|uniref:Uncharacterized protein n=1 Tax=Streblomastix strix TaxID=222440 RepID=A0A5J4WQ36_9EUKA|nr:MAG: hypothetical protein EZS28_007211 [Streblomastix strix]
MKLGRIYQGDHTSQDYQTSVMEWLDSLTYTPKNTNQFPRQQQAYSYSQHNKLYNQKRKVNIKNNQRMNQKESQLLEQMTMETMTNLCTQSNPSITLTETMDSERMTAGRSYRLLSTEKRILRLISQKTSANNPPHNLNGSDRFRGNGCGKQLQAATNENGHQNHNAIDNSSIEDSNEQANDNRIGEQQQNKQRTKNEIQHQRDSVNNNPRKIGPPHTTHSEQKLGNPNISQPKCQPPLIPHLPNQVKLKRKLQFPNNGCNQPTTMKLEAKQVKQSPYPISPQGVPQLEPTPTLITTSYPSRSKKRQMQPQLLQTSPQNTPKATRPVQDPRNRIMDSTLIIRQRQSKTPRLISWNRWTDQVRNEERREGRDFENCETDNDIEETLDRNEGINSEILGIMGNYQHEIFHPIRIFYLIERQKDYQQTIKQVIGNEIYGNRKRNERVQHNV